MSWADVVEMTGNGWLSACPWLQNHTFSGACHYAWGRQIAIVTTALEVLYGESREPVRYSSCVCWAIPRHKLVKNFIQRLNKYYIYRKLRRKHLKLRLNSGGSRNPELYVTRGMVILIKYRGWDKGWLAMEKSGSLKTMLHLCWCLPSEVEMPIGPDRAGACVRDKKVNVGYWLTSPRHTRVATTDSKREIRELSRRLPKSRVRRHEGVSHSGRIGTKAVNPSSVGGRT